MLITRMCRAQAARHLARSLTTVVAGLEQQLAAADELLTLVQIPGAGRGLVAAREVGQGTMVFTEFPLLLAPSPQAVDQACYHCLRPLLPAPAGDADVGAGAAGAEGGSSKQLARGAGVRFCSAECRSSANREYWQVHRLCDFSPLLEACRASGEKLPLMAARLACTAITQRQSGGVDVMRGGSIGSGGSALGGRPVPRGNPLEDLDHLCFAKIPSPPPPWRETHALLVQGLQSHPSNSSLGSAGWRAAVPELFSLDWFCRVLARLHINVFRVDTVPELPALDPAAMLRAAAGLLSDATAPVHATGSGAYLLASMLNHSCEPNLEVSFPANNAAVAFTAARDIAAGEQLCISYVDAELAHEPRRQALEYAYGFQCKCPKCREGR